VWEHAGTITLKAAGLDAIAETEAKNTWLEILGQSLGTMARSIGAAIGREVGCEAGAERGPAVPLADWAVVTMRFADTNLPLWTIALSPNLLAALASPDSLAENAVKSDAEPSDEPHTIQTQSRTMDLLLDVDLPVSISFGKAQLPLKDILKLTMGSIVELDRGINDQVEVLVNHCLVARGEVVVVEGNYGVRIQEIASRRDRLRSLR
jgi:flagellar motor switch protein FliN/FliY